jgi:nicotinamide-nucleotide adenylyltransferase
MKTVLFVGRFQPFHKGHEHAIKSLLRKFDNVIIAIGSINKRNKENPFTFLQRRGMINSVLSGYENRYKIIGIYDTNSDENWTRTILKKSRFDVIVTGNKWTKKCFKEFKVIKPEFLEPKKYNATRVRKLIRKNKDWEKFVPKKVVPIIKKYAK